MGSWDGNSFAGNEGDILISTGGRPCRYPPSIGIGDFKSSQVKFFTGNVTEIVYANEASKCVYEFEMTCNPNDVAARNGRRMEFLPVIPNSTVV